MYSIRDAWKQNIDQIERSDLLEFNPLRYSFIVRSTEKAIMFKMQNGQSIWIPRSVLKCDHSGSMGEKAWVYCLDGWGRAEPIKATKEQKARALKW